MGQILLIYSYSLKLLILIYSQGVHFRSHSTILFLKINTNLPFYSNFSISLFLKKKHFSCWLDRSSSKFWQSSYRNYCMKLKQLIILNGVEVLIWNMIFIIVNFIYCFLFSIVFRRNIWRISSSSWLFILISMFIIILSIILILIFRIISCILIWILFFKFNLFILRFTLSILNMKLFYNFCSYVLNFFIYYMVKFINLFLAFWTIYFKIFIPFFWN